MAATTKRAALVLLAVLAVLVAFVAWDVTGLKVGERVGPLEMALLGHHHGSPAYSDARDVSYLNDGPGTEGVDDHITGYDLSCGNGHAAFVVIDNGSVFDAISDADGCQKTGPVGREYERNLSGHTTCNNYSFGRYNGCGFQSGHGS